MSILAIGPGTRVTLHFSLELDDGTVVDSNFEGSPAAFDVGDGSLLPGFEAVLEGMTAGDAESFTIEPENGFGQHNPQNIQRMKRSEFPEDMALEPGLVVSFADPSEGELPGVIASVDEHQVMVDFNHPLAGRNIRFTVKVLSVEPAQTH
ncbi:MAG: FKBP-type peptidyl-prolyl cis-trans isomerase [bacterium]